MTSGTDQTTLRSGAPVLHTRATLVFYHRDGAQVAQLEQGRAIVVGRAPPADVVIPDPGLSRRHARFSWDAQGLWVEDLQSTNGTRKNGAPVERAKLSPGDEIAIGPVVASVHVVSLASEALRGFDGHDRFVAALAEELVRARTFGRPLALLMVRAAPPELRPKPAARARGSAEPAAQPPSGHVGRWAGRLRAALRPVDRVGIYGPEAVLVSIPEAAPEAVRELAATLSGGEPPLQCSVVTFPGDGGSAEELIAALHAARRAPAAAAAATADDDADAADAAGMVVKDPAMKQVMAMVKRVAQSTIGVLIHGETGTGKEVIARAIHDGGPRRKQPLRSINCAAIPATLIESALFGHEQGAFTSADRSARGIFEQAQGGTVLLDEIGELAAPAQAALLRVLETKRLTRVGGDREIDVDVRVIAATHRDLEAMVQAGQFREDLLFRLNTMTLRIPPLRERPDEIRPLAERFLKAARRQSGADVRTIEPDALAALERYPWPGNVRELRNVIERAVVLCEGKAITLADLTERLRGARVPTVDPDAGASGELPGGPAEPAGDYKDHVRRFETDLILRALRDHGGNQTAAAKALGLPLRTLVHKIQTYGIKKKFER